MIATPARDGSSVPGKKITRIRHVLRWSVRQIDAQVIFSRPDIFKSVGAGSASSCFSYGKWELILLGWSPGNQFYLNIGGAKPVCAGHLAGDPAIDDEGLPSVCTLPLCR